MDYVPNSLASMEVVPQPPIAGKSKKGVLIPNKGYETYNDEVVANFLSTCLKEKNELDGEVLSPPL